MKQKVIQIIWLRICFFAAVMTTAFSSTAWANEPIEVELEGFSSANGQIDGNIAYSTTDGSCNNGVLSFNTLTLTANNQAKINSITFHYAGNLQTIQWIASNSDDMGTFQASINEPSLQNPTVSGLSCKTIVFSNPTHSGELRMIDDITVTYTPGDADFPITASSSDNAKGTVVLNGNVIVAIPKSGYGVDDDNPYTISEGTASIIPYGSKYFAVLPTSDCAVTINFVAHAGDLNLDFEHTMSHYTDWSCEGIERVKSNWPQAHGGSYIGETPSGTATASVKTTAKIGYPGTFSCYVCPITGGSATWKVQVSSDNSTWRDVDGNTLSYTTGWSAGQYTVNEWYPISVDLSSETNVYVRLYYSGPQAGVDDIDLTVEAAPANPTVPVTVSRLGYSTLYYSNKNLVVPEGITAYTYLYNGSKIEVSTTYVEGDVIPEGTGVVLQGAQGTYDFDVTDNTGVYDGANVLRGCDEPTLTVGGDVYYALSYNDDDLVGFYWMSDNGGAFVCQAHKAYLALPFNGVKGFVFEFEEDATAIESIQNSEFFDSLDQRGASNALSKIQNEDAGIFNLAGQRLQKMQKGINIVNGKKIAIK